MASPTRARRWILATSTVVGLALPTGAHALIRSRTTGALSSTLTRLTGMPSRVGRIEAGLTGTLRLEDVDIGTLVHANAVEASVALGNLLSGNVSVDEVRVESPRVSAHVDRDGTSDLARLVTRINSQHASTAAGGVRKHLRRVVVTEGALVVDVDGFGSLTASGLELHPQAGGVRLVTGDVVADGKLAMMSTHGNFARVAADIELPSFHIERLVAVRGQATLDVGGDPVQVDHATLTLGTSAQPGMVTLGADVDDRGVPRRIEISLATGASRGAWVSADGVPLASLAPLLPPRLDVRDAHLHGTISLARTTQATAVEVSGSLQGAKWNQPDLSLLPVPLDLHGKLTAQVAGHGGQRTMTLLSSELGVGAVTIHATGDWQTDEAGQLAKGDVAIALDSAPCLAALESVPLPLRGPTSGLTLDGSITASAHLAVDLAKPPGDGVTLDVELDPSTCTVTAEAPLGDPHTVMTATDHHFPDGSHALIGPTVDGWRGLDDLPDYVAGAFTSAEDARFFLHHGFDLAQIAHSLEIDLREHRIVRGGSTISQQLVKNVFLNHRRSFDRKLQEAVLTWRLEATTSKRDILAYYLNVIELGPGVYGIEAAAEYWFGVHASHLTVKQAAFLAALTSEPQSMSRRIAAAGKLDAQSADHLQTILRKMYATGVINSTRVNDALSDTLDLHTHSPSTNL